MYKNSPRVPPFYQIVQQLRPQSCLIVKSGFQLSIGPAYKTVEATYQTDQQSTYKTVQQ
jgi:hypothetical protein